MQIGELAKAMRIGRATLDRYVRMGLLPCSANSSNGYRDFSEERVARRLQLIQDLRDKPFRLELDEIKRIFDTVPVVELQAKRNISKQVLRLYLIDQGLC